MKSNTKLKVGIIGLGAIGQYVANSIEKGEGGNTEVVALLCRDKAKYIIKNADKSAHFQSLITDSSDTFYAAKPDVVIEAAGQETLAHYGADILEKGIDLVVSSIGLFTNDDVLNQFISIAEKSGARLLLSSGALPAVDWMSAASLSKVNDVSITQTKPVNSWKGTPAENFVDLDVIKVPTCFFEGTARESASLFPKSSNISAMLALATVGLDSTKVKLIADPTESVMYTDIEFDGEVGRLKVRWQGVPSSMTPSTSADVPLTIVKTLKNLTSAVCYGV